MCHEIRLHPPHDGADLPGIAQVRVVQGDAAGEPREPSAFTSGPHQAMNVPTSLNRQSHDPRPHEAGGTGDK